MINGNETTKPTITDPDLRDAVFTACDGVNSLKDAAKTAQPLPGDAGFQNLVKNLDAAMDNLYTYLEKNYLWD